jgi:ribosome maturation factor RimP
VSGKVADELFDVLEPVLSPLGLDLVDVELGAGLARVVVDRRDGPLDLDAVAEATRVVSAVLDDHDPFPNGRYTLEVSSPGLERTLRTPRHFVHAIGEVAAVRTVPGTEGERRVQGRIESADENGFVLAGEGLAPDGLRYRYEDIERARTVFNWKKVTTS